MKPFGSVLLFAGGFLITASVVIGLTFCGSMDGPRNCYAVKSASQRKTNTIWYHLYVESNEQNKLMNTIEKEVWIYAADWQLSEGRGLGDWMKEGEGIKQYICIYIIYI